MTLEVVWHPAAVASLLRLHWRTASSVDAAVLRFAALGVGHLERIPERPTLRRLVVERVSVVVQLDRVAGRLVVWSVYRHR